jgi:hypothetical protein
MKAFDLGADVKEGQWVKGPDGRLDLDVAVRGTIDGKPTLAVIECKDFDLKKTGKVGREYVDALDSKRHDLNANIAMICSNSGFTEDALNKAARKGIGAISVLYKGDRRVKVINKQQIVFRKITLGPIRCDFPGTIFVTNEDEFKYDGLPVKNWIQTKAINITMMNSKLTKIKATFNLTMPNQFQIGQRTITLGQIVLQFTPETRWFSRTVELDAGLGLYDYLRGQVKFVQGANSYEIKGMDFDKGVLLDDEPEIDTGMMPGEVKVALAIVEDLVFADFADVPKIDAIIIREQVEDLAWGTEANVLYR